MAINSLPSNLQDIIQQGMLKRMFEDNLRPKLAYRALADREDFPNKIGETLTMTRPGLLVPNVAPLNPLNPNTANAMVALDGNVPYADFTTEQFTLSMNEYGAGSKTNIVTEGVAIESKFIQDAKGLFTQAGQSVDRAARNAVFSAYMGGQTRVTVTLGSANSAVKVDDIRGFVPGASVVLNGDSYTVAAVQADANNISTLVIVDDAATGFVGGVSGTVTMTNAVTVADGTAGNALLNSTAPGIFRPNGRASTAALQAGDTLSCLEVIAAVSQLRDDNVPDIDGLYNCYLNHAQLGGLQQDPIFQNYTKGLMDTPQWKQGFIVDGLGLRFIMTTETPIQNLGGKRVHRALIGGKGLLVEGVYTRNGYKNQEGIRENSSVTVVDDIAHIITGPQDATSQVAKQLWYYIGGFVAPTDIGTNSAVMPTASNCAYKRGKILESL